MGARRWAPFAAGIAVVLAGCGVPFESGAHFASSWDQDRHTTFAWNDAADRTQGDRRLEGNSFFHARLHEAVEWELNIRGIRLAESDPALQIHHHLTLADHEMEREVIDDSGVRGTETQVYEGGSVVLHITDARTGDDVWIAWAQGNVEPALVSPDSMRRWVYDMVGELFEDWPVPARSGDR